MELLPAEHLAHYLRHGYEDLKEPIPLPEGGVNDLEEEQILDGCDLLLDLPPGMGIPTNQPVMVVVRDGDTLRVLGHPYLLGIIASVRLLSPGDTATDH